MKRTEKLIVTVVVSGFVLGACSGFWWQMQELKEAGVIYRSLAKLVVSRPVDPLGDPDAKTPNPDFYGTIIEIIESAEMNRKAREHLHETHPKLECRNVEASAVRSKGSGVIAILATGDEPRCTQLFLNALLDEFVAFRKHLWEQRMGGVLSKQLEEVVLLKQEMEEALVRRDAAWTAAPSALRKPEEQRLGTRLAAVRDLRDETALALKLASDTIAREGARSRLETLSAEVREIEESLMKVSAANTELSAAENGLEKARKAYDEAFARASGLQREIEAHHDVVDILERATMASGHSPSNTVPLLQGIVVGGCAGGALSVPAAFLLVWRPRRKPPLPPVDAQGGLSSRED